MQNAGGAERLEQLTAEHLGETSRSTGSLTGKD